jgi:hypothetical protein
MLLALLLLVVLLLLATMTTTETATCLQRSGKGLQAAIAAPLRRVRPPLEGQRVHAVFAAALGGSTLAVTGLK